jgi:hypothetical protein
MMLPGPPSRAKMNQPSAGAYEDVAHGLKNRSAYRGV